MDYLSEGRIDPKAFTSQQGGVFDVYHGGEDNLPARIYERDIFDRASSEGKEEPVFKKVLYIEVQHPPMHATKKGDVMDVPLTEEHKRKYPKAWAAWLSRSGQELTGTPLGEWKHPLLDGALVRELAAMRIITIEQVAMTADGAIGSLGPNGRWLRQAANDELTRRRNAELGQEAASELEKLKAQVAELMASKGQVEPVPVVEVVEEEKKEEAKRKR